MTKNKISPTELASMLVISRMFVSFSYSYEGYSLSTTAAIISTVLSFLIILLIFVLTLKLKESYDSKFAIVISLAFAIFLAADTLTQCQYFLNSAVYTHQSPLVFIVAMTVASVFMVKLNVQSLGRLSVYVLLFVLLVVAFITFFLANKVDLSWLEPIEFVNAKNVLLFSKDIVLSTVEPFVFVFFLENLDLSFKKGTFFYTAVTFFLVLITYFFTFSLLGNYKDIVPFPFYTVSCIAHGFISESFNYLYITMWVFITAVRTSMIFFVVKKCLEKLKVKHLKASFAVAVLFAFLLSLSASQNILSYFTEYVTAVSEFLTLFFVLVLPSCKLFSKKVKK